MDGAWPVDVATIEREGKAPSLSCGALTWRYRGALRVTVVAKAVFDLVHDQPARLRPPEEIVRRDQHVDNDPTRSVREATDCAPYRPRADVTFIGTAFAAAGTTTYSSIVRLALYRDTKIIERTLHVFGDRDASGAVRPFQRMVLAPERALASRDNPAGKASPNIVDPRDATIAACFSPVSRYWPPRARFLRGARPPLAEGTNDYPDDFDWSFFQAAPSEQQVSFLRGDEWVVLDGVHPKLSRIKTQLPMVRGRAIVYPAMQGRFGQGKPLELVTDGLSIDGDRMTCSVSFRGSFTLDRGEAQLGALKILVGLAQGKDEPRFPPPEGVGALARPAPMKNARGEELGDTRTLVENKNNLTGPQVAYDPNRSPSGARHPAVTGPHRPVVPSIAAVDDDDSVGGGTSVFSPEEAARLRVQAPVPFGGAPPNPLPAPPPPSPSPHGARPFGEWTKLPSVAEPMAGEGNAGTFVLKDNAARDLRAQVAAFKPPAPTAMPPSAMQNRPQNFAPPFANTPNAGPPRPPPPGPPPPGPPPPGPPPPGPPPPGPPPPGPPPVGPSAFAPPSFGAGAGAQSFAAPPFSAPHAPFSAPQPFAAPPFAAPAAFAAPPFAAPPFAAPPFAAQPPNAGASPAAGKALPLPPGFPPASARPASAPRAPGPSRVPVVTPDDDDDDAGGHTSIANFDAISAAHALPFFGRGPGAPAGPDMSPPGFKRPTAPVSTRAADNAPGAPVGRPAPPPEPSQPHAIVPSEARENVKRRLAAGAPLDDMDLTGVDLSDLNLSGRSLLRCNLRGAKLRSSLLRGARLANAVLEGADLTRATLDEADLTRADLTRATLSKASLAGAKLSDATFASARADGVVFRRVSGQRVTFAGASLVASVFDEAELAGVDFTGADISSASFESAMLPEIRLGEVKCEGARFDKARISRARAEGANLARSTFCDADASDAVFTKTILVGARFDGANLKRANFREADCSGGSFHNANLEDGALDGLVAPKACFINTNLARAKLENARAEGADFEDANLVQADLRAGGFTGASFVKAGMRGVRADNAVFAGARMVGADLSEASLKSAVLTRAWLNDSRLDGADLRSANLEGANVHNASRATAKLAGANTKDMVDAPPRTR